MISNVKDLQSEILIVVNINDIIQEVLDKAQSKNVNRIAVKYNLDNFLLVECWKLFLVERSYTIKRIYRTHNNFFVKIKLISDNEKIENIITDLYSGTELIYMDNDKMGHLISLYTIPQPQLKELRNYKFRRDLEQRLDYKLQAKVMRIDLSSKILTNDDLIGKDLRGACLKNTTIKNCNLEYMDLNRIDLSDSELSNVKFSNSNLINANLSNSKLFNVQLSNSKLNGANLKNVKLINSDLTDTEFWYADLSGADLKDSDIQNAKFNYAIFDKRTSLTNVRINAETIDTLPESALRSKWDPCIKKDILDKLVTDSLVLKTKSFLREDRQEEFQKKTNINKTLYDIRATVESSIEEGVNEIDRVVYRLHSSYPKDLQTQTKSNSSDKFQLKELACGGYLLKADVYLKGKDTPVELKEIIKLNK